MNNEYVLYAGIILVFFGVIQLIRDYIVTKRNNIVEGVVIRFKNKTKKRRTYCYPEVIVHDEGLETKMFCYSARRSGHDRFSEGEVLKMYKYRGFNQKNKYKTIVGFWSSSYQITGLGVVLILTSIFFM